MPLTLRRASVSRPSGQWSEDDYDIGAGELVIGRVMQIEQAGGVKVWRWWLHAITGPSTLVAISGNEPDLEAARAAIAENWRAWVRLAGLREEDAKEDQS